MFPSRQFPCAPYAEMQSNVDHSTGLSAQLKNGLENTRDRMFQWSPTSGDTTIARTSHQRTRHQRTPLLRRKTPHNPLQRQQNPFHNPPSNNRNHLRTRKHSSQKRLNPPSVELPSKLTPSHLRRQMSISNSRN